MAHYQISRPLSVQTNVHNLNYEGSWGTFTYGEPRRVSVSMKYRF